ncbi:MAG: hypothetical protein IPK53_19470 [bacterium]|nr:hypothetical protein [bacterium]
MTDVNLVGIAQGMGWAAGESFSTLMTARSLLTSVPTTSARGCGAVGKNHFKGIAVGDDVVVGDDVPFSSYTKPPPVPRGNSWSSKVLKTKMDDGRIDFFVHCDELVLQVRS